MPSSGIDLKTQYKNLSCKDPCSDWLRSCACVLASCALFSGSWRQQQIPNYYLILVLLFILVILLQATISIKSVTSLYIQRNCKLENISVFITAFRGCIAQRHRLWKASLPGCQVQIPGEHWLVVIIIDNYNWIGGIFRTYGTLMAFWTLITFKRSFLCIYLSYNGNQVKQSYNSMESLA